MWHDVCSTLGASRSARSRRSGYFSGGRLLFALLSIAIRRIIRLHFPQDLGSGSTYSEPKRRREPVSEGVTKNLFLRSAGTKTAGHTRGAGEDFREKKSGELLVKIQGIG